MLKVPSRLQWICAVSLIVVGGVSCFSSKKSKPRYEIYEVKAQSSMQTNYSSTFDAKPGWPPTPRRDQSFESTNFHGGSMMLGIKIPAFGGEIGSTTRLKFDIVRKNRVWILMHTPTMTEQIYGKDSGGGIFLNAREGYKMVAVCMFSAHLSIDGRTMSSLTWAGSGIEGEKGLSEETAISQMSDFYPVKMGDTVKDWFSKCDKIFDEKVRASVERDFEAASTNLRYHVKQEQCVVPENETDRVLSNGRPGDASCEPFFNDLLPGIVAHYTARCIPQTGLPQNVGFCRVRSPETLNCRLFKRDDGSVSEKPTSDSTLVTGPFSYDCDKTKKLRCVVKKEGGWFQTWSEIHRDYEGMCVK